VENREAREAVGAGVLTIIALVLLIVVGGGLVLVGKHAGWWLSNQNAIHENQQIQNGVSNQETLRAQITSKIADVDSITVQIANPANKPMVNALKDQRMAIAGIACADAAQITGVPLRPQQAQWVSENCSAGVVRPGSKYYVTTGA